MFIMELLMDDVKFGCCEGCNCVVMCKFIDVELEVIGESF